MEPSVTTPMYWRIAQELRQQIKSGHPGPGEQLPTELELGERYEASRNTVRDGIKWLTANGLVETRPGQGTFVRPRIVPFITTLSALPETRWSLLLAPLALSVPSFGRRWAAKRGGDAETAR